MAKMNQQRKGNSRQRVHGFLKPLSRASSISTASVPSAVASRASASRSNSQSLSSAALACPPLLGSSPSRLPALCPPPRVLEVSTLPTSSQQSATSLTLEEFPTDSPPLLGPDSLQLLASPPRVLEVPTLLSNQQSTKSLTIWEEVFGKVNKETTEWIQKQGLNFLASAVEKPEDQIKELIDLIKKKEKAFEEKDPTMKIKIGKQEIVFRAYIADVVGFLTMAGDVAMNFAPPQASAPWAAVKAVLKIPVKQIEQMAVLAAIIQLFTRIVRRGQVYEVLYDGAISTEDGTISNMRSILVDLNVSAIELLARCDILIESGVVKQMLNSILRPEQVSGLISDLSRKEQILSHEVQIWEALRNKKATKQLDEKLKRLLARLDVTTSPLTRTDEGVAKLLKNVNKENDKLEKLMDFISSEQFGKGHATMKDTRIQGTGDWLMEHESLREWQAIASSSTLLCLKGTVGTGKTYLTSRVIDHIKHTLEISPHDEGFAFFYCNRSGPFMQDPLIVLRSFVRQLSYKANDYDYIQSNVIQRCEKAKQEGRGLGYADCKELILESMNLYSKTTIVLDALDESDISCYNLAEIFIDMLDKAKKPVKVFISSRPDREFLEAFKDRATIKVDSSNQQGDIEKYLDEALYSTKFFGKRRLEIQDMIKETFSTRNDGMFRWVYLQTKSLQKCVSDDAIRTWAKTIPRDLMAAYDRLWEDLANEHNESDMALAERAIKWVLCAFKPLKSGTLLEAIRFAHEEDGLIQIELRTEQEILTLCQDLLTVDAEKKVWMLSHASVAEYFESRKSKGMGLGECDAFVSRIQLDFLMTPKLELLSPLEEDHAWESIDTSEYDNLDLFKRYVQTNWFKHVQRYDKWLGSLKDSSHATKLTATLKCFLGSPGESSDYYRRWMNSRKFYKLKPANMAIFIMCQHGFFYTLRDWWERDKIDQKLALAECKENLEYGDDLTSYALPLAVEGGCLPMCRYLVSAIGAIGLRLGMFHHAARLAINDRDIIKFLVEEVKVDLNMVTPGCARTVAQVATICDRTGDGLQYLVDQGWVSANRQGGPEFGNPLIAAANNGNLQSLEILLRAGADAKIAAESGEYGTALIAAAASEFYTFEALYETVMVTLLNSGADIDQVPKAGKYGSALEAFVCLMFNRHEPSKSLQKLPYMPILKLMLKSGANPAMTCNIGQHGSALAAAAFYGMKDTLVTMVEATDKERAIECLRQSRHPSQIKFHGGKSKVEAWEKNVAETATYLAHEVGVDKKTLRRIGMQGVKFEHGSDVVYIR